VSETLVVIFTLQDYARGLESMKEAEMWMKYSTLSETKTLSFKKEIAKNIEFLSEKVRSENEWFFVPLKVTVQ
jgi:hypothetical protein